MMRSLLLASARAVCAATPALAQSAAAAAHWSGFYAGINAGYGGDSFKYPTHGTFTPSLGVPTAVSGAASQTSSGFIGGGQLGYDYQISDGLVIGAVADIDATSIEGKTALSGSVSGALTGGASGHVSSRLDYLGTVRARAGMPLADGRFMPFVTGGLAYGQVNSSAALNFSTMGPATAFGASRDVTRTGWTVGGGADYLVTDRLRFGVEYLYADLGTATLLKGSFGAGGGVLAGQVAVKSTANIIRVTLNYQFGG